MYTVETLLDDEDFIDYCLNYNSVHKTYWDAIITANPECYGVFEEAKAIIKTFGGGLSLHEINEEIHKIKREIASTNAEASATTNTENDFSEAWYVNTKGRLRTNMLRRISLYAVAACVVIFACIYFLKPSANSALDTAGNNATLQYKSLFGKRQEIKLPDGSEVILNSNSNITLDKNFNATNRTLQLTGEAFFKVAKDPSKPFVVKSNDLATTAVGTEFYVFARNAGTYKVDLLEGKVKLNDKQHVFMLAPGEEANWDTSNTQFLKSTFDSVFLKKWLTGKISFSKTPVKEAIDVLQKWYAVEIKIDREDLLKQSISGDYENVPLEDILKVICFTFSCKCTYNNNTVIIE